MEMAVVTQAARAGTRRRMPALGAAARQQGLMAGLQTLLILLVAEAGKLLGAAQVHPSEATAVGAKQPLQDQHGPERLKEARERGVSKEQVPHRMTERAGTEEMLLSLLFANRSYFIKFYVSLKTICHF